MHATQLAPTHGPGQLPLRPPPLQLAARVLYSMIYSWQNTGACFHASDSLVAVRNAWPFFCA